MIVFVATAEHPYTVQDIVKQSPGPKIQVTTYDELFRLGQVPLATYIFTDVDRLPLWRLRQVAMIYRQLREGGARVLNDPARLPSRFGLLRRLYRLGINSFNAYRVEEGLIPKSWPVFLRCEGGHDAPLTDLMHDWDEVLRAVDTAIADGAPLTSLLLVEYAAEPVAPGLFRKLSMYRLGDTYVAGHCVHEGNWLVKYGTKGIATPELYEDELRLIRDNPFEAALKPAFELAGIEYGRADFGLVGGKVEIYEINTNPHVKFPIEPAPFRAESHPLFRDKFYEALGRLDFRVLSDQTS